MGSFKDLVRQANEKEEIDPASRQGQSGKNEEESGSSFKDLVASANNGTINTAAKLDGDGVNAWYSGVTDIGRRASEYLTGEGYRTPDTDLADVIDRYLSQAADVGQYIRVNRGGFDNYDETIQSYHDVVRYLRDLQTGVKSYNDYYAQWDSEDAYLADMDQLKTYEDRASLDLDAAQKEIDELKDSREEIARNQNQPRGIYLERDNASVSAPYGAAFQDGTQADRELYDLAVEISRKEQELNLAKYQQEGERLGAVAQNADFGDFSGYDDRNKDAVYSYINGRDNGTRERMAQSWQENRNHNNYLTGNAPGSASPYAAGAQDRPGTESLKVYDYMNETEIATYNYHYAKDGKEAAERYLHTILERLNARWAEDMYEGMEGKTWKEIGFGVSAGLDQYASGMNNLFDTRSDYIPQSAYQIASGMVREDLKDVGPKLPDWMGGATLGQVGYDAITTTANMAPSLLTSVVLNTVAPGSGAVVGTGMMGMSAAGNAYQEMLNQGYNKGQARLYSTLVGASEAGLEYLLGGINALGGKVSGNFVTKMVNGVDNAFARFAIKYGDSLVGKIANGAGHVFRIGTKVVGKMASEGLEEGLQEILTPMFRNAAMHTDEDINWSEVFYSGMLGAITGGLMEGPGLVGAEVKTYQTGKQLQAADISATRLAEIGNTFAADTVAHQLAGRVNENTGAYTMGRLFNEIGATLTEQNRSEITQALVKEGLPESVAKEKSRLMAMVVDGMVQDGKMSDVLISAIEEDTLLAKAVRTTVIDPNATWFQRSRGYNEALMALAQEKAAPKASRTSPAEAEQENAPTSDKVGAGTEVGSEGISEVAASPAKVSRIASIGSGKVTVKLEDGSEVDAADADLDPEDGVLIETIAKIGGISAEDANYIMGMIKAAPGTNSQWTALGATEAYRYGFYGMSEDHMVGHGVFSGSLTEAQRKAIYETGRKAGKTQADGKQSVVSQKGTATQKTGKVHFEGADQKLTERQRESLSAMEKIAQIMGVQIYVFQSKVGKNGKHIGKNGWYDPRDNSIHIDLYAGQNGEGTMLFTLAHELTHHIRKWSPAKFKILADFLVEEYGKLGVNVDGLIRAQMAKAKRGGRTISYDTAYEEMVADSMETMLVDGNVIKRLAKLKARDQGLWHEIKRFINKLAAKIRNVYKGLKADSVEGRYVADMGKTVYKLQELFAEALVDASENFQSAEVQKNTTEEGGVRYQERESQHSYSKSFADQLTDYQNGKIRADDALVVGGTPSVLKKIGLAGLPMTINQKHIGDALNGTYKGTPQEIADHTFTVQELSTLPEKIADPIAVIYDKRTGKANASESNIDVLVEMTVASGKQVLTAIQVNGNGRINGIRIDANKVATVHGNTDSISRLVDAINENVKGTVAVFYINNNKTTKALQRTGNPIPSGLSNLDGFIHSITDPGSPVKMRISSATESQQFKRWFGDWENHPENASKVLNADGTPKVMYHGSPAQFTIFDKKKAKSSGLYGKGFYFTDSASHASTYGNQYAVYLNIRNPLESGRSTVSRQQVRKFLEEVAENEEYSIENYGTYDVDEILNKIMGSKRSLDAFQLLQDVNATAIGNLVEAAELFNKVNGTEFDGIVVPTETVAFRPEQIKSATDNIGTFDPTNPDIRYSDRDTESVSNRSLLAEALEGVAQTDWEKQKLTEYKGKIRQIEDQERKLRDLNQQIKELSFAKGPRDKAKLSALRDEATKTANRINILDKQLLRLEASKPLQDVLEREKKKAYRRAEQKGKEALAEYKQEAERQLTELREKYGTIRAGEKTVRSDALPVSTDGKNRVSWAARTVKGAAATPDEFADLIDVEVAGSGLTYIPITNNEATRRAREWLEKKGWKSALRGWQQDVMECKTGADMFAMGALLLNNAAQAGNKEVWLDILYHYQFLNTNTAQGMQAARILKQLQPEDKLYMAERSIEQMVRDMRLNVDIQLNKELVQAYKEAKSDEESDAIMAQIQQDVADQIPSTFMDKWTALRYVNMLGNLRTQLRNAFGNAAMMGTTRLKDEIAASLEAIAYAVSGGKFNKTKAFINDRDLLKAAKQDFATVEALVLDGGKYTDQRALSTEFAKGVMEKRRIFKLKLLEKYRTTTNWAMDKGDALFSKAAYAHALANYLQGRGVKGGDLSMVDPALLDDARVYAVQQAQEATFRDSNTLSRWISTLGRKPSTPTAGRILAEGIMPFRKTPANMLVRAEEYSPIGLLNSLGISAQSILGHTKLVDNKGILGKIARSGEQITGAQIVESWAKTLTGTGLFFLGVLLRNCGWLVGGPDDDEELDRFEELNGQQNYAFHFGDLYITVDFLSPSVIPMFMGAQMADLYQENGFQLKDLEAALTSLADPLVEMSMLQGLNDTLANVQYAENNLVQIAISASVSYLMQGLTNSFLGQWERSFEDSRRSTYVDKDSAMPAWLQRNLGQASAKTPGLDYNQVPYINAWGEEEQNPNVLLNAIYNMLSPSYVSKETQDAVSQELTRLNEAQSDVNVFPSTPGKTFTYEGEERNLTAGEYVALSRTQGQKQRQIIEKMVDSALYDGLPDAYKAKAISFAYDYAREYAQIEELGREEFSSDWMAEIRGDIAEGILKHVIEENIKSMYLSGDISADEAIQRRMEYHGDTKEEATEKIAYWDFQTKNPEYSDWNESTVTKYKDLAPDTAAHVIEVLDGLGAEAGYTNVRPIQKIEAIVKDAALSAHDKDTALRAIMDDNLEEKYDSAQGMGFGMREFALAYRKYQDTEGEGKKANVVSYYMDTFKISESKAEELYDLFAGRKKE